MDVSGMFQTLPRISWLVKQELRKSTKNNYKKKLCQGIDSYYLL